MKTCSIGGCGSEHVALGYCRNHWYRLHVHGDPLAGRTPQGEPQAFIDALPATGDGCVTWPFSTNNAGYGQIKSGPDKGLVSRAVCRRFHGPPPTAAHVAAHSCGKGHEACIAPWHLSWKTSAENTADAIAHGTHARGERQPTAKLTEGDVREIRQRLGLESQDAIAADYGVSQRAISKIARGETWVHVGDQGSSGANNSAGGIAA